MQVIVSILEDCPVVDSPSTAIFGGRREVVTYGLTVSVIRYEDENGPGLVKANLPAEYDGQVVEFSRSSFRLADRQIGGLTTRYLETNQSERN